jgi:hypothetical protein
MLLKLVEGHTEQRTTTTKGKRGGMGRREARGGEVSWEFTGNYIKDPE